MQESDEGSPIAPLRTYSDLVEIQEVERTQQSTLDRYFHQQTVTCAHCSCIRMS